MSVFSISEAQNSFIDCIIKSPSDEARNPYVFRLTTQQAARLREEAGQSPTRFRLYDADDANAAGTGEHWNIAVRISADEIEIPYKYLLPDMQAEQAEAAMNWTRDPALERRCGTPPESSGAATTGRRSRR